jgi:hypothetical protein
MEFLSNPLWQFIINATIAILAIIIPVLIYRKKQNQRGITYQVISNTSILNFKEDIKGRVQVLFDNKPVGDVRLVILKIWNSGNIPILPNEHIDPLKFDFGKNVEILDTDVLETVPGDIKENAKASLKPNAGGFILEPLLLNSNDSITLNVLVAQPLLTEDIRVNARIVGVNQIIKLNGKATVRLTRFRIALYSSYLIFLATVIFVLFSRYENNFFAKLLMLLILVAAGLIYIILFILLDAISSSLKQKQAFLVSMKNSFRRLFALFKYVITARYE